MTLPTRIKASSLRGSFQLWSSLPVPVVLRNAEARLRICIERIVGEGGCADFRPNRGYLFLPEPSISLLLKSPQHAPGNRLETLCFERQNLHSQPPGMDEMISASPAHGWARCGDVCGLRLWSLMLLYRCLDSKSKPRRLLIQFAQPNCRMDCVM
jgi:hypothetical protein